MKPLLASILLAAFFGGIPQRDFSDDLLTVHVNATEAQIRPLTTGQRAGYGESIAFSLRADFHCAGDAAAESIVVSISDTFYRHVPAAGEKSMLATVNVPGEQIVPAEAGDFCNSENYKNGELLRLPAAATVHVSLRCRLDGISTIRFVSAPLPLQLVCQGEAGQDRSASSGLPAR
ncbi:MAG: hypothetical protein KJN77_05055 [Gammaproteobacteria bacterium]|nr:hypothetical protein [Gammaproteobacteria bacterium]